MNTPADGAKSSDKNYKKLRDLLTELFQLDQSDLDFGIYRVMAARRDDVLRFLDHDLRPQVEEAFAKYRAGDRAHVEKQLTEAVAQAKNLGVDPESTMRVQELRSQLLEAVDTEALEANVYNQLVTFFSRYYHEGDFISQRRYREGVYAIPYEGEEIKLYWANHDQYYIKTAEHLTHYAFRLPSDKRVRFELTAAMPMADNNKPLPGQERRFMLHEPDPVALDGDELVIRFEYGPDPEKRKQSELNAASRDALIGLTDPKEAVPWLTELRQPAPTKSSPERMLLEKHLQLWTARNTFDYFIHKDLGGFLRRELDFYIKNELFHFEDLEDAPAERTQQQVSQVKVLRSIAQKIIDFLTQLEGLQKKLWLKKKFVVETNYCITLQGIPEAFYPEIAKNDAQREEWVLLFAINEIKADIAQPGYSQPLKPAFLKAHPALVVDTRHFDADFTARLLTAMGDVNEQIDGLLLQSENFQALSFIQQRYCGQVSYIYIDPPFNTSEVGFLYKNAYRHSSWLSMVHQALLAADQLLPPHGLVSVAIDDAELFNLGSALGDMYGSARHLGNLVVEIKPSGRTNDNFLSTSHEYYLWYAKEPTRADICYFDLDEEAVSAYSEADENGDFKWRDFLRTGGYSKPEERPHSYYSIFYRESDGYIGVEPSPGAVEILPLDSANEKRVWRKTPPSFMDHVRRGDIRIEKGRGAAWKVRIKDRIKEGIRPKSVWVGSKYDAATHGTKLLQRLFGEKNTFPYPKALHAVFDAVWIAVKESEGATVLDFFAGSGTTGHAVINLNREDGGDRKFILVEMGEHFDTVLLPRIKKVTFTPEWKDGKPTRMATPEEVESSPRIVKYVRLESYEDALNNLELKRSLEQTRILGLDTWEERKRGVREDYVLRYILDVESRGSLLNVATFEEPFDFKVKVIRDGDTKWAAVDLVETFNWLLGLRVRTLGHVEGVRVVIGSTSDGDRVLVLWRSLKEVNNDQLDAWFERQGYNTRDLEFDLIYVNGDNNLENLRKPDQTWKVRLIEAEFHRLMFDVEDV